MGIPTQRRLPDAPVGDRRGRRPAWPWLLAALPVVLVLLGEPVRRVLGLPPVVATAVGDLTQCAVAVTATVVCTLRARAGHRRREAGTPGWALLSVALAGFAGGQSVWAYHQVVLGDAGPSFSLAEVGFLLYAVLAPLALLLLARGSTHAGSWVRTMLDGVVVAGALAVVSWLLVLQALVAQAESFAALALAAAYPISDAVALTVAITLVARTRLTAPVAALAVGAALMAVADSTYVYVGATGAYDPGGLLDATWTAALVAVTAACLLRPGRAVTERRLRGGLLLQLLPYLPLALALAVVAGVAAGGEVSAGAVVALGGLGGLVLVRQWLVVVDNARLTQQLRAQASALATLAYTDPLTGLANRAAFTEALERTTASRTPLVAAFCDLDRFKAVNDVCGHAVGDALLVAVAARLREVVRADDVVARLGGDEFAVLAVTADAEDEAACAAALRSRLVTALSVPFDLPADVTTSTTVDARRDAVLQAVSASVGVVASAEVPGGDADALLQEADRRMYTQKRGRRAAVAAG
ncbi:sensor domain-containing diguanylate cyclase [Pseudokineococcus lusitanus]|uniref:Diguanylate cyclase (GGDEF)-like protein n=1 Tax=Pseudokineococcus lusitanus TaxID=763993 RepID=A0A3N1HTL6_9ACTN|nr:GGDEF domain-containing protein [Pseudokineococcus lusitanus]ROP45868.1 diguanylate cyclase (GGDEF)-like protein [Pseudokineococcus lusitanus]